jgi:hypothetical protein
VDLDAIVRAGGDEGDVVAIELFQNDIPLWIVGWRVRR